MRERKLKGLRYTYTYKNVKYNDLDSLLEKMEISDLHAFHSEILFKLNMNKKEKRHNKMQMISSGVLIAVGFAMVGACPLLTGILKGGAFAIGCASAMIGDEYYRTEKAYNTYYKIKLRNWKTMLEKIEMAIIKRMDNKIEEIFQTLDLEQSELLDEMAAAME